MWLSRTIPVYRYIEVVAVDRGTGRDDIRPLPARMPRPHREPRKARATRRVRTRPRVRPAHAEHHLAASWLTRPPPYSLLSRDILSQHQNQAARRRAQTDVKQGTPSPLTPPLSFLVWPS
jgi:hypothetical protein